MGCNTGSATIEFPAKFLDDEIRDCLVEHEHVDIALGDVVGLGDTEVEISEGIFRLHDSEVCYGEFEELETLLAAKEVPFDRTTAMDWTIEPRLRVFRPGGVDDSFLLDPESYEPVVPVAQIRALLGRDDPVGAAAVRRWLDEHFPAYPPLSDWVKTMDSPTNEDRGYRVITLLDAYTEIVDPGDEGEDYVITDMIADLLHLAHLRGHDAETIMRNAMMHFETETGEAT